MQPSLILPLTGTKNLSILFEQCVRTCISDEFSWKLSLRVRQSAHVTPESQSCSFHACSGSPTNGKLLQLGAHESGTSKQTSYDCM